jgi:hypothetical protein
LQRARRRHSRLTWRAIFTRHHRVGAAADCEGAGEQQRHMPGAFYRRGRLHYNRLTLSELRDGLLGHVQ